MSGARLGISRLRQRLRESLGELGRLIPLIQMTPPLVRGHWYERRRRCGKANCRCARGALHKGRALVVVKPQGAIWVSPESPAGMQALEGVGHYQQFRQRRSALRKTCRAIVEATDQIGRLQSRGGV